VRRQIWISRMGIAMMSQTPHALRLISYPIPRYPLHVVADLSSSVS